MTERRAISPKTLDAQWRAASPDASAWVSANAGSGKTHVLTQRVIRLLLDGASPTKILCLTFTKAAAANMSLRVFETLARWTALDDSELEREIVATGARFSPDRLAFARRLFARTVETPGGLKIQTIHGFCEGLLHLFPFEANAPARFEVLEEERRIDMLARARATAFEEASADLHGPLGRSLSLLAAETSSSGFDSLINECLARRGVIIAAGRAAERWPGEYRGLLGSRLGLSRGDTLDSIERDMIEGGLAPTQWNELAAALERGGANDVKLATRLRAAERLSGTEQLNEYLRVFLTDKSEPRGSGKQKIITAALQKLEPDLLALLEAERDRLVARLEARKAAAIVERTCALMLIVERIFTHYTTAKNISATFDFDDLIERTVTLLSRSNAQWVLYKLDSGIDHILVDEAQDTSREQWEILRALAGEFTAGEGQRPISRTFFAVGDEKQSIYSFQGAEPLLFDAMRRHFQSKTEEAGAKFSAVKLEMSFRSAPGVLTSIDSVFSREEHFRGLSADNLKTVHEAWKSDLPSLVEIWEPLGATSDDATPEWRLPLDMLDPGDPALVTAERIATLVASWLAPNSSDHVRDETTGRSRPIRAGDVMILVRKRGPFFEAMIRCLKDHGVPVAGADRLALTEHIAVMDLIAAGRAALLPEDDLAVACVMKSPLIGLDDDDLIALAPPRKGSLLDALAASSRDKHRRAAASFDAWRKRARALTPFFFYSSLLDADRGRAGLIARLGPEAGDAIDEFLRLALAHERDQAPSLAGFLARLEASDIEIKRDMEAAGDAARVMTVHGAKGLEAKVVILPDSCGAPTGRFDPDLFVLDGPETGPVIAWSPRKETDSAAIAAARDRARLAAEDEHRRLLYVAMTRAEERLYVMGFHGVKGRQPGCWHDMILGSLEGRLAPVPAFWNAQEMVWRASDGASDSEDAAARAGGSMPPAYPQAPPPWLISPAPFEPPVGPPLRPSSALAAADQQFFTAPGEASPAQASAALRGRLTHELLQYLPGVEPGARAAAAARYLSKRAAGLEHAARDTVAARALAVIAHEPLSLLFGPNSRSEVAIAGKVEIGGGRMVDIVGQIDRLVETPRLVLIADFKTGTPRDADACPPAYVAQLALYTAAVANLFPTKTARALLIWTDGPTVVEFEDEQLAAALMGLTTQ